MFNIRDIRGILTRRNEQSRSSDPVQPKTPEEEIENSASSAEGFLCPHCFLAFPTADALQNHYESSHSEGINDVGDGRNMFNCPACKMKLGSEIELQSHYTRHHSGSKEDLELEAMQLQVKALEEGKALLQSELQAVRMQSSEIMKENTKIREERDALEYKAAKLAGELADLKADLDELKTKKLSAESALKLSEEKIHKLEVEIQQRPEADDVSLLQQELVSVQKMMDQLTLQREAEKDTLQKQCNNLKETCLKLQERKTELEGILKSCPKKEELESLQEKISQMSITISQLQKDVQVKEAEKSKLLVSLEKYENYDEIKAQLSETQSNLAEMQRLSSEKDSLITKLKNELKTVKENVEEMKVGREQLFSKIEEGEGANAAMLQLKEENARLQEQFLHQQTLYGQTAHETETKMSELRSSLKMATSELQASNEKCTDLEKELAHTQEQLKELQSQKDDLQKELNLQLANLSAAEAADKARLQSLEMELESVKNAFNEKMLETDNLQIQLKERKLSKFYIPDITLSQYKTKHKEKSSHSKAVEFLETENKKLKSQLTDFEKTVQSLEANLSDKQNKLQETEQKLQFCNELFEKEKEARIKSESEFKELQESNKDVVMKLQSMENAIAESEAAKGEFCEKISSLNEDLLKSQLKESELNLHLEKMHEVEADLNDKLLSFEEENKNLRTSVTSLQNEKNSLLSELETAKKSFSDLTKVCASHERQIEELTDSYQKAKSKAEQILKDSELAKEIYLKDKVKMQKQIESLENDCAKQLSQVQETVKQLENQLEDAEEKNASLVSALDETKKLLQQKEKDWEEKEARHIAQVGILTQNIQTLREDLSTEQKRRETIEIKLDEISGTKLELEAKLENALDERQGLLKRCLQSESECERLQASTAELRRKYEDCVAALQELGRENQTLQVENMKHITRKWADDAEVTHCTACGKLFTVTIRKHHCRNCGNIFCNECSAKTATVASSKRPVRVCDVCYVEVTK